VQATDLEVVWSGGYLCIATTPETRAPHPIPTRERYSSKPVLAQFAQHGPMTIRTLQTYEPQRKRLYALVDMLRKRGKLIVFARSSDGILYSLPPTS
jgi:hypothetical protein